MSQCIRDGCDRQRRAGGLCGRHYQRWQRTGEGPMLRRKTPGERFWDKVDASGDCWIWMADRVNGYGRFHVDGTTRVVAHRWSYEALVGEVPAGLQLDHLCRNRSCVNPDHLEPVTDVENQRRGSSPSGINHRKSRCRRGHPFEGDNLWVDSHGHRHCRECQRAQGRQNARRRRLRGRLAVRRDLLTPPRRTIVPTLPSLWCQP